MQTLVFNSTSKTVKLYEGNEKSEILYCKLNNNIIEKLKYNSIF